jgi:hypothetical protein
LATGLPPLVLVSVCRPAKMETGFAACGLGRLGEGILEGVE